MMPTTSPNPDSPDRREGISAVCADCARRARRLRRSSWVYLVLTFVLLFLAGVIFNESREWANKGIEKSLSIAEPRDLSLRAVDLNDLAFNPRTGEVVAVGRRGLIQASDDRGERWREFGSDARERLTRKSLNGIALSAKKERMILVGEGGFVRYSDDGGATWSHPENLTPKDLYGVALSMDAGVAVAVGEDDTTLVSRDGGRTWTVKTNGGRRDLEAVALRSERAGVFAVAVGDRGAILTSSEVVLTSGDSNDDVWSPAKKNQGDAESGDENDEDLRAVAFSGDGQVAIAVGEDGATWVSVDGGKEWDRRASRVGDTLEAVALNHDGSTAVAVGGDGTILVFTTRDKEWKQRASGTPQSLSAVAIIDDGETAIVVGDNATVLRSKNGSFSRFSKLKAAFAEEEAVFTEERERQSPQEDTRRDSVLSTVDFETNFLRVGTVLILLFMVRYLISLTRYNLRLAAFYDARRDAIRLTGTETFPRPASVRDLERMMHALSPDEVDLCHPPRTIIGYAMRLARWMSRRK